MILVAIISHDDKEWILECLRSVHKSDTAVSVIIVDNGDGTSGRLAEREFSDVRVIYNSVNIGFAGAANQIRRIAIAEGFDYLIILNADVSLTPTTLSALRKCMAQHPAFGILGPVQFEYPRVGFSPANELNKWTKNALSSESVVYLSKWLPRLAIPSRLYTSDFTIRELSYVQGAAFFIDRRALIDIGMFDELYFIFHEEVDYCRRAWWKGYRVGLVQKISIYHQGRDLADYSWTRVFHRTKNRYYYLITDPSVFPREILHVALRWLASDLRRAVRARGTARVRLLAAIPATGLWLIWKSEAVMKVKKERGTVFADWTIER